MTDKYTVVSIKMLASQVDLVERYARALNANIGHNVFTRSNSMRALIDLGLATPVVMSILNGHRMSVASKKRKAKKRTTKRKRAKK